MGKAKPGLRVAVVMTAGALALAACGNSGTNDATSGTGTPTAGGKISYLTNAEQFDKVDPQRIYTGEDLAFFSGTIFRTLTAYKFSKDAAEGTSIVPDLATDTGTQTNGGKTWAFTLRDGVLHQRGRAFAGGGETPPLIDDHAGPPAVIEHGQCCICAACIAAGRFEHR
jgi:peptide/nickel transport system substrate-binding protein